MAVRAEGQAADVHDARFGRLLRRHPRPCADPGLVATAGSARPGSLPAHSWCPAVSQDRGARCRRRVGGGMSAVGALLGLVLLIFELILVVRVVLDWVGVFAP